MHSTPPKDHSAFAVARLHTVPAEADSSYIQPGTSRRGLGTSQVVAGQAVEEVARSQAANAAVAVVAEDCSQIGLQAGRNIADWEAAKLASGMTLGECNCWDCKGRGTELRFGWRSLVVVVGGRFRLVVRIVGIRTVPEWALETGASVCCIVRSCSLRDSVV